MYPAGSSEEGNAVTVTSEDAALIMFRLENGAIGSVVLSEVSHGYSNYLAYEITGDRMTAGWNSQENNSVYFSADSLPACPSFREGAEIVRLCSAVCKSASEEGRWIHV